MAIILIDRKNLHFLWRILFVDKSNDMESLRDDQWHSQFLLPTTILLCADKHLLLDCSQQLMQLCLAGSETHPKSEFTSNKDRKQLRQLVTLFSML